MLVGPGDLGGLHSAPSSCTDYTASYGNKSEFITFLPKPYPPPRSPSADGISTSVLIVSPHRPPTHLSHPSPSSHPVLGIVVPKHLSPLPLLSLPAACALPDLPFSPGSICPTSTALYISTNTPFTL